MPSCRQARGRPLEVAAARGPSVRLYRLHYPDRSRRRQRRLPRRRLRRAAFGRGELFETVETVDIVAEVDDTVADRPSSDVNPVDRDLLRELHVQPLAILEHLLDRTRIPSGRVAQ